MRLLLVDDHPMIHQVLAAVSRSVFDSPTVLFAKDLGEALERAREPEGVDLVLLDLGLPGYTGIEALTTFREAFPRPRVIVVSATEDRTSVRRALDAGAAGYVPKTHSPKLIGAALRLVAEGGTYVPPQALHPVEDEAAPRSQPDLTERQIDVLRLILRGLPNKSIATRLKIAEDTVRHHACAAYAVLGVSSRTEAMAAIARRGIRFD